MQENLDIAFPKVFSGHWLCHEPDHEESIQFIYHFAKYNNSGITAARMTTELARIIMKFLAEDSDPDFIDFRITDYMVGSELIYFKIFIQK
jgi:hypothetical protein